MDLALMYPDVVSLQRLTRRFLGSEAEVSLRASHQRTLTEIARALEARDPRLASMFSIFTRLTRDEGAPRHERITQGPRELVKFVRTKARRARASAAAQLALLACLMATVALIATVGTAAPNCAPLGGPRRPALASSATCRPAPGFPGK